MKKVFLLSVLAAALIAVPAFASVQTVKVSGDVDTTFLVRDQFDLGDPIIGRNFYQNLLITQTRLRVDADLTDNVQATVALINERVWDEDANAEANDIDINLAYVKLKEMLYSPLTVIIGRQNFAYGNSLVVDSAGTNNNVAAGGLNGVAEDLTKRTALDAVRMVFDYNPLTIDVVAAKVDANNNSGRGAQKDDVNLFGTNANYQLGDEMKTTLEAYFWAKVDQSVNTIAAASGHAKSDTIYTPGLRASANVLKGLNLSVEGAIQRGNKAVTGDTNDNVAREAQAGQVIATYAVPVEQLSKWSPVLTGAYTYLSGDSNPAELGSTSGHDDRFTAWDPMFENQSSGKIYNTLFNYTDAHILTAKAQVKPIEDVTASVGWDGLWLQKEFSNGNFVGNCGGLYGISCAPNSFSLLQPDGTTTSPRVTTNRKIGDEFEVGLLYDYTEDVHFGARANWFRPGAFFHSDNQEIASQYMLNGIVNF